jgi:hypothetical protein
VSRFLRRLKIAEFLEAIARVLGVGGSEDEKKLEPKKNQQRRRPNPVLRTINYHLMMRAGAKNEVVLEY